MRREVFKQGRGNVGGLARQSGAYCWRHAGGRARPALVREALAMFRKDVGDDDPDVLFCMANVGRYCDRSAR